MERVGRSVARTWSLVSDRSVRAGPRAYVLVIGRRDCRAFELPVVGELAIGRDVDADVVVDDRAVSRCHARLIAAGGEVRIVDRGSHNGTRVNGVAIDGARLLANGDEIAIGDVLLVLHLPRRDEVVVAADGAPLVIGEREVIVADPAMVRIYELLARVGKGDLTVLVCGETGVGKENAAYAVHHHSGRRDGPFISINCAAIQETLAESELFGHEKGAFSGAACTKAGLLEAAAGGTVFLDEVGELPLAVQAKLLRVLQEGEIQPVGSGRIDKVDVRVVASTNRDLAAEAKTGTFREDLYYRLAVVELVVPPLRDRKDDIPALAAEFARRYGDRFGLGTITLEPTLIDALVKADWPGNVRQLENTIARLAALSAGGVIGLADYQSATGDTTSAAPAPVAFEAHDAGDEHTNGAVPDARHGPSLKEQVEAFERGLVARALDGTGGNQSEAARRLGVSRVTLIDKMKKYGLNQKH